LSRICPAIARELEDAKVRNREKQADEALRKSEENFRLSLDDSPLGVRIVSTEGETIYANQALLDIYGYDSIEEINRIPIKERYTPQSYAGYMIRKEKRERGELGPPEYEISIVRKNGEILHLRAFRKEILWNGVKKSQIIYQDITERKREEEKALREKHFSDAVIDSLPGIFYLIDKKGQFVRFNKNMADVTGYSTYELSLLSATDVIKKEDRKLIKSKIEEAFNNGHAAAEASILTKDGREFPYYFTAINIAIEDNIFIIGMGIDISERKRTAEVLRESEEKYRLIFEYSPLGLLSFDEKGVIVACNDNFVKIIGSSQEKLIGLNMLNLPDKNIVSVVQKALKGSSAFYEGDYS